MLPLLKISLRSSCVPTCNVLTRQRKWTKCHINRHWKSWFKFVTCCV